MPDAHPVLLSMTKLYGPAMTAYGSLDPLYQCCTYWLMMDDCFNYLFIMNGYLYDHTKNLVALILHDVLFGE
jgi:hypothetical protein